MIFIWTCQICLKTLLENKILQFFGQVSLSDSPKVTVRHSFSSVLPPSNVGSELLTEMSFAEKSGIRVANKLLELGAREILNRARLETQAS
jgi:hypothetical protein